MNLDLMDVVALTATSIMFFMVLYILSRHYRYWAWTREVRWQHARLDTFKGIIKKMKQELRDIGDMDLPKRGKKVRERLEKVRRLNVTLDEVEWEYSEIKKRVQDLLTDGPP